ncbi:MAG: Nitrate transport protein NrtA [Paracidovorax wautersii]|uniref:Nitrate transport protein NrtA n=1 Tax=Paracidovorax wautersii TaxID=1177982 RepID=A0A7V8FQ41_9BURK|nr:MAG: Nitrate transport protein NrtA [Paracidovorax wautersii]
MNEPQRYHHICASSGCDCHLTRRDLLRLGALSTAAVAAPLLAAGQARAQAFKGDDQPVRIGYLPITDATPLLVAHARQLYEAEGLRTEAPRLFRSWAQLVEAFVAGQVNVIHLLSPATLWVRYGTRFPAKIVAWNHTNGSALTVAPQIGSVRELGGKTVAIPFWYSIHNIVLQRLLRENGLVPVVRPRDGTLRDNEVNLVVLPPAEMVSALAGRAIAGFIVADPFNAAAETLGVGKVLRFTGDVWKDHACCVLTLAERDTVERPEWAQRVTTATVRAQLWVRGNQTETAKLLARDGPGKYTPHTLQVLNKVLTATDYESYERAGVVLHRDWQERRIDFQPYPYPSYTEELVKSLRLTHVEGQAAFLNELDPAFAARDLVDDRFVRRALEQVGGLPAFGRPAAWTRREVLG